MEDGDHFWWLRKCTRCSMRSAGGQLCRACYDERARAVYWNREPACRAKGPTKAECLLVEGHDGDHEGNGFDCWGPVARQWRTSRRHALTPAPGSGL